MNDNYFYYMEDNELWRFKIERDEDCDYSNPRENTDCNIGTMVCWHHEYTLGDEQCNNPDHYLDSLIDEDYDTLSEMTTEEKLTYLTEKDYVFLPIAMYEHSGITIWCGSKWHHFDAQWDCSDIGFIYTTKEKVMKTCDGYHKDNGEFIKLTEENWREVAEHDMEAEVKFYDTWLQGDVYWYQTEKFDPYEQEWEEKDSCGGFLSDKWDYELAREIANSNITGEPITDNETEIKEMIDRASYPLLYMYG